MTSKTPNEILPGPTAAASSKRRSVRWLWIAGPLLILAAFGWEWLSTRGKAETDNAYVKAERVMIAPQVAGRVVAVLVNENEAVKQGQLLFRIDPEPLRIAVDAAQAKLDQVSDSTGANRASVQEADSTLRGAEDSLRWAQEDYARQSSLVKQGLVARKAADDALHVLNGARAARDAALAAREKSRMTLGGKAGAPAEQLPEYRAALAALEKAKLDLQHADVTAPVTGVVATHDLQVGEYLNVGQVAMPLVALAPVWIEANFKETDLRRMRVGQTAKFRVDSFPGVVWSARVASISPASGSEFSVLPAQNASGNWVKIVQRIPVRLELTQEPANAPLLRAGMSADVTVDISNDPQTPRTAAR
jgi:membrane fusion protein (multidrug efflux system)